MVFAAASSSSILAYALLQAAKKQNRKATDCFQKQSHSKERAKKSFVSHPHPHPHARSPLSNPPSRIIVTLHLDPHALLPCSTHVFLRNHFLLRRRHSSHAMKKKRTSGQLPCSSQKETKRFKETKNPRNCSAIPFLRPPSRNRNFVPLCCLLYRDGKETRPELQLNEAKGRENFNSEEER